MSPVQPPLLGDGDNGDVTGFISLSHIDSVRLHMRPSISDEEAIAMIGGVDLRQEINELEAASNIPINTSANADTVPKRGRINISDDSTGIGYLTPQFSTKTQKFGIACAHDASVNSVARLRLGTR